MNSLPKIVHTAKIQVNAWLRILHAAKRKQTVSTKQCTFPYPSEHIFKSTAHFHTKAKYGIWINNLFSTRIRSQVGAKAHSLNKGLDP